MPTLYSKQRRILQTCSLEQNITVKLVSKIRTVSLRPNCEGAAYNLPTYCLLQFNDTLVAYGTDVYKLNIEKDDECS